MYGPARRIIIGITLRLGLVAIGLSLALPTAGCDWMYSQPSPPLGLRIQNGTDGDVEVTITVESSQAQSDEAGAGTDDSSARAGSQDSQDSEQPAGQPLPDSTDDLPAEAAGDTPADVPDNDSTSPDHSPGLLVGPPGGVSIGLKTAKANPAEEPGSPIINRTAAEQEHSSRTVISESTVRVPARQYTDGALQCGDVITVTARLDSGDILLQGDGTGTVGFDEGSVGVEGERLLIHRLHYDCGDTLVLDISSDPSDTSAGLVGTGQLEVYRPGQSLPTPTFDSDDGYADPDDVLEFRIDNQSASFAQVHIILGQPTGEVTAVADTEEGQEAESDGGFDVRVPPGHLSTGLVECDTQVILVASIVVPGLGIDEADTFNQVVLDGDGTGTSNFDGNSVGTQIQQRLLEQGRHYECGDVISIQITTDGNPASENPTLGTGTVAVTR